MNKKFKLDASTIIVLSLALVVIVIAIIAVIVADDKDGASPLATDPPVLTFPPVSDVPQRDDIKVTYSERTSEDTYEKDGIEYIYSFISYPLIEGGNSDATLKINEAIQAFATERVTIKEYEKTNAEDAYNRADAAEFVQFEFVTSTESVYTKNGYLSIAFRRVKTMGLNDPSELITTMCFDLMSGDEVDISSFMNTDSDTATSFILDIFEQHMKINPNVYYNDALETLPDIVDLKSFYLTDDGAVLYFNPNVVTPSVNGVQKFIVPYDKIGY